MTDNLNLEAFDPCEWCGRPTTHPYYDYLNEPHGCCDDSNCLAKHRARDLAQAQEANHVEPLPPSV